MVPDQVLHGASFALSHWPPSPKTQMWAFRNRLLVETGPVIGIAMHIGPVIARIQILVFSALKCAMVLVG